MAGEVISDQVTIKSCGSILTIEFLNLNVPKNPSQYAFYLYKNGRCIEKIWYQNCARFEFPLLEAGSYFVKVFIRPVGSKEYRTVRSNSVTYRPAPRIKRSIRLKEWGANTDRWIKPSDAYLANTEKLPAGAYRLRTDASGFITSGEHVQNKTSREDVNWVFLGDSFLESAFTSEDQRFCAVIERKMRTKGEMIKCRNGGYSGATSLHLINNLLNKVIPLAPRKLFFFVPTNDCRAFRHKSRYWNNHKLLSPILPIEQHHTSEYSSPINPLIIALELIKCVATQLNSEFIVCTGPHRSSYDGDAWVQKRYLERDSFDRLVSERNLVNQMTREWCKKKRVSLLDLERNLSNYSEFSYDDLHLTNEGSLHIAGLIIDYIEKRQKGNRK